MIVRTAKEIGVLLRSTRRAAGMTQTELAERLGVSQAWVSEVEQGKERAEIGKVLGALAALGLQVDVRGPDQTVNVEGIQATGRVGAVSVATSPYSLDEIV